MTIALAVGCTACESSESARPANRTPRPTPSSAPSFGLPSAPIAISGAARHAASAVGFDLRQSARRTLAKTLEFFPDSIPNISIEVKPRRSRDFPVNGFTTYTTGQVFVYLNPAFGGNFRRAIRRHFPGTLAHELDHSARIFLGPGYGHTILKGMVSEGLAEAFRLEVYPDIPLQSFKRGFTRPLIHDLWALARPHLHDPNPPRVQRRWFFGKSDLPNATGYVLGFGIVRAYLRRHPGVTAHELTLEPAKKILRGSHYDP